MMAAFGDRIQSLMDEVYGEWQKEGNQNKGKWDILDGFSEAHQIAVVFGNFNYQVENGGISQWIYNGYFHDDAEKFTEFLEAGAVSDERCQNILGALRKLGRYAAETDCGRDGYYHDTDDGERGFIGDIIDYDFEDLCCKGWMSNPLLIQQGSQPIRSRMKRQSRKGTETGRRAAI